LACSVGALKFYAGGGRPSIVPFALSVLLGELR